MFNDVISGASMVLGPHVSHGPAEATDGTHDGGEEKCHLQAAVRNQEPGFGGKGSWGDGTFLN